MIDPIQCPPLPADLSTAHKELRYWQRQVILERERVARMVEKNEMIRRSMSGNVKALQYENAILREQIRLLTDVKNG